MKRRTGHVTQATWLKANAARFQSLLHRHKRKDGTAHRGELINAGLVTEQGARCSTSILNQYAYKSRSPCAWLSKLPFHESPLSTRLRGRTSVERRHVDAQRLGKVTHRPDQLRIRGETYIPAEATR